MYSKKEKYNNVRFFLMIKTNLSDVKKKNESLQIGTRNDKEFDQNHFGINIKFVKNEYLIVLFYILYTVHLNGHQTMTLISRLIH